MSLYQKITDDIKTAMKSGDKSRLEVLRFSLAGMNAAQKEKQMKEPDATLTDKDVVTLLQKEVKKRKDSIELFKQGGRRDLVDKESADMAIIAEYIPAELSHAEIEKIVDDLRAGGMTEFSELMRETMKAAKGRTDGKTVGDIIKAKTS